MFRIFVGFLVPLIIALFLVIMYMFRGKYVYPRISFGSSDQNQPLVDPHAHVAPIAVQGN